MSTATLRLHYRAIGKKVASGQLIHIPFKFIYFLMAVCSLCLLVLYIVNVNQLTQGAYTIKNYNKEVSSLSAENDNLQATFAESSFLGTVQEQAQALSFEKVTNVKYVQILQNSLAQAK
jgi:hypothetical protein